MLKFPILERVLFKGVLVFYIWILYTAFKSRALKKSVHSHFETWKTLKIPASYTDLVPINNLKT